MKLTNAMSMASLRGVQEALDVSFDYLLDGEVEPSEKLWHQINASNNKIGMEILIKLIRKFSGEVFTESELKQNLAADIHRTLGEKSDVYVEDSGYQVKDE